MEFGAIGVSNLGFLFKFGKDRNIEVLYVADEVWLRGRNNAVPEDPSVNLPN